MSQTEEADYLPFPCPGCGRKDGAHPPMCQVAVRLTAAHAAHGGKEWRRELIAASVFFVEIYGCVWFPAARHLRAAAVDDPPDDEPGEELTYAPAVNLFRPESQSV